MFKLVAMEKIRVLLILTLLVSFGFDQEALEWKNKPSEIAFTTTNAFVEKPIFEARTKEEQEQVDFVRRWLPIAKIEQSRFGIPVSVKLAQGICESKSGSSLLCKRANNYFGVMKGGKYCEYGTAWESWRHHSKVLNRKLYRRLHGKDYKFWAIGLQKIGYAEDVTYANTLISIIQRWNLQQYDYCK